MKYACGCTPPDYCPTHRYMGCHFDGEAEWDELDDMCPNCVTPWKCNGPHFAELECPACRSARWRSVSLDARATPTRNRHD